MAGFSDKECALGRGSLLPAYRTVAKHGQTAGDKHIAFASCLTQPEASYLGAPGEPLRFMPHQIDISRWVYELKPEGGLRYKHAFIFMPKRNGKSLWSSTLALFDLLTAPRRSKLYAIASAKHQISRTLMDPLKALIEDNPELQRYLVVFQNTITNKLTGSRLEVMASNAGKVDGATAYRIYADELHRWVNPDLWGVLVNSMGTVPNSMMITISTAGPVGPSIVKTHYQRCVNIATGEERNDRQFFVGYEIPLHLPYDQASSWPVGNPAFGFSLFDEDFEDALAMTSEGSFRRLRCNQFWSGGDAWPVAELWDDLAVERNVGRSDRCVLSFHGSHSKDSTALCLVTDDFFVQPLRVWRKPEGVDQWQIDTDEIFTEILKARDEYNVALLTGDPSRFGPLFLKLDRKGLPIKLFKPTQQNLLMATKLFEGLAADKELTHNGDPILKEHLTSSILHEVDDENHYPISPEAGVNIDLLAAALTGVFAVQDLPSAPSKFEVEVIDNFWE